MLKKEEIEQFQRKILDWYVVNRRDLPWRRRRDAYGILVSEVMLQQTQVVRVIPKYEEWMRLFPRVEDLAGAKTADVLGAWSGLGYNRRALYLKKLAEVVDGKYTGSFPEEEKELLALPGIGKYTARAVLCFAFDRQVAVVDTNVKKVILTQLMKDEEGLSDREIWEIAERLVPVGRAYDWNQALMDYASAMLREERIAIPRQSAFKGSRRYYRGRILKRLLEKREIEIAEMGCLIKEDFTDGEGDWLRGLVGDLEREGFVRVSDKKVELL